MLLPHLIADRIRLRPLTRSDIPALTKQANDRTIAKFMPSIRYPYTADTARRWINLTHRQARNGMACQLGIELVSKEGIIGMMGLKNLNRESRNGELEYWLGRRHRGRSYASEAMELMLEFGFGDLCLHRIYAIVAASNIPSVKLLERYGLKRESVWREAWWMDKRWHDVYGYGMLETEAGRYK